MRKMTEVKMQLNARQTDEYSLSLALFGLSLHAQQA